jgi:hypothetical protein
MALISAAPPYRRFVTVGDISSHASIGSLLKQAAVSRACNEGILALPADSLVECDQSISVAAAIRTTAAKAVIVRRFMEACVKKSPRPH